MLRTSLVGALFAAISFTALAAGIERDAMDTSTAPGDDFWTYANGLNFPAGILQPPFYDPAAPAAVNYGGIGAAIGHEISHSFDNTGAQFDAAGHLRNWWTDADLKQFKATGEALANQFDGYKPFLDLGV